ncbi:MAG: HDIG domain-containing protein [Candidatus Aenigmarchaeota archaeon]|nr:HDIG domain-containing protein [Candidatus Aenigmarchaeota archaeon]
MPTFKYLLELAGRIKDSRLRKMVIDTLRNPGALANKNMKLNQVPFEQAPASIDWHHTKTGGLLEHTYAVTKMCISVAEDLQKVYKSEIDMDALIAGALLHDIGKVWGVKKTKSRKWQSQGAVLDHTMLGTAELHARHFPEKVVHIVAAHFGDQGPTPPQTIEAYIVHMIDNMDAVLNSNVEEPKIINLLIG